MDQDQRFTADNAAAVWRRAAQLQAEAAQRLEERSRELSAAATPDDDAHELTLSDLRAAASDVGIAPEFVALAVAEVGADPAGALPDGAQEFEAARAASAVATTAETPVPPADAPNLNNRRMLTIVFDVVGMLGSYLVAIYTLGMSYPSYMVRMTGVSDPVVSSSTVSTQPSARSDRCRDLGGAGPAGGRPSRRREGRTPNGHLLPPGADGPREPRAAGPAAQPAGRAPQRGRVREYERRHQRRLPALGRAPVLAQRA